MYTPVAIANLLIRLDMRRGAMGLNKLVYMVHGHGLVHGRSLLAESPEVWRYGPVYRSLYDALEHLGHAVVREPIAYGEVIPHPHDDDHALIARIADGYRMVPDNHLSSIAHSEESPWKTMARERNFRVKLGLTIPDSLIIRHFAPSDAGRRARAD